MALAAKILIVSDSVSANTRVDGAGPLLSERLRDVGFEVVSCVVVEDGADSVERALREASDTFAGLIVTSGGTGFSPRDQTPEGTLRVLEREAPGLSEAMRLVNPLGRLSRGRAGVRGHSLIVNCPGSPKGALESLNAVLDVVPHALALLGGQSDPHPPDTGGSTATSS